MVGAAVAGLAAVVAREVVAEGAGGSLEVDGVVVVVVVVVAELVVVVVMVVVVVVVEPSTQPVAPGPRPVSPS